MNRKFLAAASLFVLAFAPLWAGGGKEDPPAGKPGGTLKVGSQAVTNLDPHFATSIPDIQLLEQVYEHLTYIEASKPAPDLAASWESPDGKTWTFNLRAGARFSDGRPVTAADVVASFDRLRDPKVGTPVAGLYKNIRTVEALDAQRVRFTLTEPNPEFASDVGDYHAAIIPASVKDPAKERIGSGPFVIASYFPEDRVVLRRNPQYNQKDAQGNPLPYLDEIQMIFSPDPNGQAQALRGGELDYLGGLTTEMVKSLEGSSAVKIQSVDANMHWVIHLRSDAGHPAADNRVRQALKLATSHQALIDAIRPGLASVGNGFTPVGPAFGRYHLVRPPFMDLAKAKRLLADAGYPNGLAITLYAQNAQDAVPIATVWKEQMSKIGVTVDIKVIPSDVYYGGGDQDWLKVDFGITDWGARATPVTYFKLAYLTGAAWNETHWSDPEFDALVARIDRELDEGRRVNLYHKAQEILIQRGPIIVAYFVKAVAGMRSDLQGVTLASDWPRTRFRNAYLGK